MNIELGIIIKPGLNQLTILIDLKLRVDWVLKKTSKGLFV